MTSRSFPSVEELTLLQTESVAAWHQQPISNPYQGIKRLICEQHECNYRLWHQEDICRSPDATADEIAKVKREIDKLNQRRNDLIEKIDDEVNRLIIESGIDVSQDAPINTETPGSVIDRLSIMALRIYHYREQHERSNVNSAHRNGVFQRLELCEAQHTDLSHALQQLLDDLFTGLKQHRIYRQMKMYNDPDLNPEIYASDKKPGPSKPGPSKPGPSQES